MPMPVNDLTGQTFGYLTILRREGLCNRKKSRRATWLAKCVCGEQVVVIGANICSTKRGALKSCGCRRGEMLVAARDTHGMTGHPAWVTWSNMRSRCTNPKDKDWRNYGARGITVCVRWRDSFANFWADMGPTWQEGLTLDRRRNAGNYTPTNCRWATVQEQSNNRRGNVMVRTPKGTMTVVQAARLYGIKPVTLYARIRWGWPVHKALVPPGSTT